MHFPSNQETITGQNYVLLLNAIQKTCKDSNIPIQNEEQFDDCLKNSKDCESFPELSTQDVLIRVTQFVKSDLVLYGAAKNFGLSQLSNVFLKRWVFQIENKIRRKIIYNNTQEAVVLSYDKIKTKFQKIMSKETWPEFELPIEAEYELMVHLISPLAQEIVFKHFHPIKPQEIPDHVFPLMNFLGEHSEYKYLIETYRPLMNKISFGDTMKDVTDDKVCAYIKRFQWAQIIELTDCLFLTKNCLKDGHPNVKEIHLIGSSLQYSDLCRDKFPKLESILEDRFVNVIRMNRDHLLDFNFSWKELKDIFEKADVLTGAQDIEDYLIDKFNKYPSWKGVETLLSYKKHRGKNLEKYGDFFPEKSTKAFISYLDRENDWTNSNSLGVKIMKMLWDICKHEDDVRSKRILNEYICSSLTVTKDAKININFYTKKDEIVYKTSNFCKRDAERIRALLRILQSETLTFGKNILKLLCKNLRDLNNQLFQKTSCTFFNYEKNDTRDETVALIEFLNEIKLVVSHQVGSGTYWPESASVLENPHKVENYTKFSSSYSDSKGVIDLVFNTTYEKTLPGPLFAEPTDQALACMFAQNMGKNEREHFLQKILVEFSDYQSNKTCYPLAKIVLGVIQDVDIPLWDKDSLVYIYLKKYKGVFSEEISQKLKDAYWKALLEGKLGGKTKELIDSLCDFYLLDTTCDAKKKDILDTLWQMGKFSFPEPITGTKYRQLNVDEVGTYAREAYEMLTLDK